jgi:ELWxxDGT repeat protein
LFFSARDGIHGQELWRSDGTLAGTVLVKDTQPDARDSGPQFLAGVGRTLYFFNQDGSDGDALWTSDGTTAGTIRVKDLGEVIDDYGPVLAGVGDTLFFGADDEVHGPELWKSDGTESGTVMVRDINPGSSEYADGPYSLTDVQGTVFFAADDGVREYELWKSDGTEAGTVLVDDINRGGGFEPGKKPTSHPRNGTVKVRVRTEGAGRLEVGPPRRPLIKESAKRLRKAGRTTITLRPTEAGMLKLERALRQARREGRKVGKVEMSARFTFTPCGGEPSSQTRRYTFKLR